MQTFIRAVIPGWAIGSLAGFLVAIAADRVPFLRRGLLPLGNFVVGPADHRHRADHGHVVRLRLALEGGRRRHHDLLPDAGEHGRRACGGRPPRARPDALLWRRLLGDPREARLPAAMPFIFNALKINSTLALIGAIVAEFFGTPIVGMGFRISTEVGRMASTWSGPKSRWRRWPARSSTVLIALVERAVHILASVLPVAMMTA